MPSRTVPRNQPSSHQRRSQRAGQAGVLPGCGQKCTGYLEDVLLSERKETRGDDGLTRPPQVVLGSQSQTSGLGGGERGRQRLGNQRGPSAEWQRLRTKLEGSGSRDWGRVHNPGRVLAATAPRTETRLKSHVSERTRVTEIINKTPGTRGERGERDLTYSYRKVCSQRTGMGREATAHHREPLRSASCELSTRTVAAAADRQRRVRHRETSQNASVSLCENREQGPRCHCASETREPPH